VQLTAISLMNILPLALVDWYDSGKITWIEDIVSKFIASNIFFTEDVAKWVYEIR